jgi:hypothetical protein
MSIIFPGNYVAHLNAYREQGVEALPGVEFYRAVGALPLNPDVFTELVSGELPADTYPVYVLSPDLRQDDKPRKDKALVIPAGSVVYKVAVSAPGVREATVAGTSTVEVATPAAPAVPALTAEADGYFPEEGSGSALVSILDGTALGADTAVTITTDAELIASLDPSAGACRNSPSALLVEVCYFRPTPAPDAEDAHIPYAVEAGQGE